MRLVYKKMAISHIGLCDECDKFAATLDNNNDSVKMGGDYESYSSASEEEFDDYDALNNEWKPFLKDD